jgi:hypothetical protein
MIAVAVAGLAMGAGVWGYRMWRLSREYLREARMHLYYCIVDGDAAENAANVHYHAALARKYERAARYPWLPVEPDPPQP